MSTKTIVQIWVVVFALFMSGCKPKLISNSSVKDTKDNRAVAAFMDTYRSAVVARSVPDIMNLVSPDFHETNGTPDASDDYSYDQLQQKLEKTFARVKEITLRIHIQNIYKKGDKIDVFYFYNQHSLVDLPAGEQWMAVNDVNRLVLKMKGSSIKDGFEIVSGL